jgi:hypothetical protein
MTRRTPIPTPDTPPGGVTRSRYRDRIFDDLRHDPYQAKGKYKEPAACGDCGAVLKRGRWHWASAPEGAVATRCPACQRIHDKLPAGYVTLAGAFLEAHRDEILQLVHNQAERERSEHALHRIMEIGQDRGRIVVTTTDIHLPQRIGRALESAYQGDLELSYGQDEYSVRVHWER